MEQKSSAVTCHDRKAVQKILENIQSVVKKQIDAHVAIDEAAKQRLYSRFVEIYESGFHENLSVDGVPWSVAETQSNQDISSEIEGEDEELKQEHAELQKEVDGLIIAVGKKRKHCPHQTIVQLANKCRAQCSYVKKAPVDANVPSISTEDLPNPLEHCQNNEQIKQTTQQMNKMVKSLPPIIDVIQKVEKAQYLHNQQVTSTDHLLFPPVSHSTATV